MMIKKLLNLIVSAFFITTISSQTLTIDFNPKSACPGTTTLITTTRTGTFGAGNTFNVDLSDGTGAFGSPTTLGAVNGITIDSLLAELPKFLLPSSNFKIRIRSSNPSLTFISTPSLTILPKPNPDFTFLNDSQCFTGNRYNFTSTSTIGSGTIDSFYWNWGEGALDTFAIPTASHHFNTFLYFYYPRLSVKSNLGCMDSISKRVNIKESIRVSGEFDDDIQCFKGNLFTLKSTSEIYEGSITYKSWLFGDGTPLIENVDSLVKVFTTTGIFQVRQINHHSNGCIDTAYTGALINEHPVARINTNDTDQCRVGNKFIFEANSTIGNGLPLLNYWDLTGGDLRNEVDSAHKSFATSGTRNIKLITLTDDLDDACGDTVIQIINVDPMPKSGIKSFDPELCFKNNLHRFKSTSTIASGTMASNWSFGDANTQLNLDSVSHNYLSDGNFTIKLVSVSNKGCLDSATTSIIIRPSPVVDFTINNDTFCFKNNVLNASSTTTITSGTYVRLWTVSPSTQYFDVDDIEHSFANNGTFSVKLKITSNFNCIDSIVKDIEILPMPDISFTVNNADQCFRGNQFDFVDNSTNNFGILRANKWDLGDGTIVNNSTNHSHAYLTEDVFDVKLMIEAENGCKDTSILAVTTFPHPSADFVINDDEQCINNNKFDFSNNTSISVGSFTNRFYYGDNTNSGFVAFNAVATKRYTKDTTYNIMMVSYSDKGCTDTAIKSITIHPKSVTNFTVDNDLQCRTNNIFNFNSAVSVKYGTYTLSWTFGNGNVAGNVPTASQSYTNAQVYTVKLFSTTNNGCLDTATRTLRVLGMPVADFDFNYDNHCLRNNDFQFSQKTTVAGGATMNHKWFYGDGDSLVNSTSAQKTYANANTFEVKLISRTNLGGCSDTFAKNVIVHPMPVASFTTDNARQCFKGHSFNFNSTSSVASGTINSTAWKFGDNTTSSIAAPNKTYSRADSFRVSLTVLTDKGCLDSTANKVYLYEMPTAIFSLTPKTTCFKNNSIRFTNSSTISKGTISEHKFYYGDGDSIINRTPPNYNYPLSGDFKVILKVTSDRGCTDTTSRMVSIKPNPDIDFLVDAVCLGDSSEFVNNTTIASGSIITWKWIFGNGKVSNLIAPKHKYKAVNNYDVKLIAITDQGCVDTLSILGAAIVNPNPIANFSYTKLRSWENEVDVQYNNLSSPDAITWNWSFGSMGISSEQNPLLFYNDTLTQKTILAVTNNFGCTDTIIKTIFILPDLIYYVPTAFSPNEDNINETFKPAGLAFALEYKFIVFNRWGEILYETGIPKDGWDGKYKGKLVEQGLYFYRIQFVGANEIRNEEKGNVLVIY